MEYFVLDNEKYDGQLDYNDSNEENDGEDDEASETNRQLSRFIQ